MQDLRRILRLFEFLAKPYSVTYAKVRALVRTCQETSKIHQNSDFLGSIVCQILAVFRVGDPTGYCVLVGRRSKRAKDKQMKKRVCLVNARFATHFAPF